MMHNKYPTNNIGVLNSTGMENPLCEVIYEKANEKIEKLTEFIYFAGVKVSPASTVIPYSIVSYYFYFTSDLEKDAFSLPFPMW